MNIFIIIMRVSAITLLASVMICGLYLHGRDAAVDAGSLQFHMTVGIAGVVLGIVAMLLPGKKTIQ